MLDGRDTKRLHRIIEYFSPKICPVSSILINYLSTRQKEHPQYHDCIVIETNNEIMWRTITFFIVFFESFV